MRIEGADGSGPKESHPPPLDRSPHRTCWSPRVGVRDGDPVTRYVGNGSLERIRGSSNAMAVVIDCVVCTRRRWVLLRMSFFLKLYSKLFSIRGSWSTFECSQPVQFDELYRESINGSMKKWYSM